MKVIMVLFDTLIRDMLPPYGGTEIEAPNFSRLAQQSLVFDQSWAGSLPCMPARRELHTGRYNFLHRGWGPLEPFDESMPELLKQHGVYTHLVTDHHHYWEDGGATYHNRYQTYEWIRGQEGDPWKGELEEPALPPYIGGKPYHKMRQDWINRKHMQKEHDFPLARTFYAGLQFIQANVGQDHWFLQLEPFDPHEPFHVPEAYLQMYQHGYDGPYFDCPKYGKVTETKEQCEHLQTRYKALISMCDVYLGKLLDMMDELEMWQDTMLIVNTDHGLLLGEHGWWGKNRQPFYNEVARTPLFIWDPRSSLKNLRRQSLVQMIDIPATVLDFFNIEIPEQMLGKSLQPVIEADQAIRKAALFGIHGGHVNCTDGRYVYMRGPQTSENGPLNHYTLMPTRMNSFLPNEQLQTVSLSQPFSFSKGMPLMKIAADGYIGALHYSRLDRSVLSTMLFDLQEDPQQTRPIEVPQIEALMSRHMVEIMSEHDAPQEQYERLGLERNEMG